MKKDFKILFAGGGTGGHLFSGVAVADVVRRDYPEAKILFVGTKLGMEKEIVPRQGYEIRFIKASPLKGSGLLMRIRSLLRLPKAYRQSKAILKEFAPDLVIGIGGYASGPMTLAAHFQKIFTAIIEQNAYPGFTNRQLARFVDRIFISFEKAKEFFDPEKTIFSGNPVRAFPPAPAEKSSERLTVFIMGGSQGAHRLNTAMIEALPLLKELGAKFHFIHQTGKNDLEQVKGAYQSQGFSAETFAFVDQPGPYYARTDLALCRAGAGTITELRLQGLPALLVPYPYATDDHQFYNAKELLDAGAGEIIPNQDLSGALIAERFRYFLENPTELKSMGEKAAAQAKPKAAQEVLNHCLLALA